ncbi:MAG: lipopolysaccharide heptosyltransferase I [SAR86 cluster bacterium]|uniref:Lipopolysaccharide heptosyltransferase 1 n=1 Tax=SAR86 cluster bacterium TaxID=2030880 RepID=A0A2A4MTI1_9GAMM|nr:MAG: lipopolysaccharide heptosyltransferase I [SAR86 cluster bacterium]
MRILIVKVSSLGDIIHTLPAVTDAMKAHKDLVFDWVVEESFAEIPAWHPAVDRVIPIALRRWRKTLRKTYVSGEYGKFKRQLQSQHYDLVIDAQGLIKSGIISRLARGLTVGLSNSTIREPWATVFYNKSYSVPWTEHAVDRIRQLFSRALNYSYDANLVDYGLDTKRIEAAYNRDVNNDVAIGRVDKVAKKVIFLHGTTWRTKHWPENYWIQLAQIAASDGYQILVPWGNEQELARAKSIADGNSAVNILDKQSLLGLAAQIQASQGVIAVDTGLGHLAAALSKPVLSLYGPTDPGLSGTYSDRQLHLKSSLGCAPCIKKTCSYSGPSLSEEFKGQSFEVEPPCFAIQTPELVWHEFKTLLKR